jgi:excisionase family DNA binding protein
MSQLSPNHEERPVPPCMAPLAVAPLEAARLLSVCVATVYNMMRAGQLDSFHAGKSRRIPMRAIETYIARQLDTAACGRKPRGRG